MCFGKVDIILCAGTLLIIFLRIAERESKQHVYARLVGILEFSLSSLRKSSAALLSHRFVKGCVIQHNSFLHNVHPKKITFDDPILHITIFTD